MSQENETMQLSFREQLERSPEAIAFRNLMADQRAWAEEMNRKRDTNEKEPKGN